MSQILSAWALGLLVGALLAEGFLLVPYWRSLPAAAFASLHEEYGPRLYRFFAPLTIAPTVLSIFAAVASVWVSDPGRWATLVACALFLAVAGTYVLYFKRANARFAAGTLSPDELSSELARWASWHWVRVTLGMLAFFFAILGVHGFSQG